MSLRVYFLRHGETTFSQSGGYSGVLDVDLTEDGRAMAQAFAEAYKEVGWTALNCSPMKRTQQTIAPIAQTVGLEPLIRDGLRESDYGSWEGRSKAEVEQTFTDDYYHWMTEPAWNPPTDGETAVQVSSRAMTVIAEIEDTYTDGNVLVVSHKTTLRIILCSLLGIDLGRYRDRLDWPAASLSIVSFERYGPMMERMGDRSYMPPELVKQEGQ